MGQKNRVSEELSSMEIWIIKICQWHKECVSEELSSMEIPKTRLRDYGRNTQVSEELSSMEILQSCKMGNGVVKFQKNLVVWKFPSMLISLTSLRFVSEELSSMEIQTHQPCKVCTQKVSEELSSMEITS